MLIPLCLHKPREWSIFSLKVLLFIIEREMQVTSMDTDPIK